MFRKPNLMAEKEREIDYLSRLTADPSSTLKTSKDIQQILVDFILRHKLDLNGQTGNRYTTFREHGFEESFIGGFGSRHQIARLLLGQDFNIQEHVNTEMAQILSFYKKLEFDIAIKEECITYSLKKDYTKLEDIEYIEFVYDTYLATDKGYYPSSVIIIRHYLDEIEPTFSMVDEEDKDMDMVITMSTSFNRFHDLQPVLIHEHKEYFCTRYGLDVNEFNDDMNTLIQMMDV